MLEKCKASEKNTVKEITWLDARDLIKNSNPELFHVIESLCPSAKLKIIDLHYSFGSLIIKNGYLQLPVCSRNTKTLQSLQIDYSHIPLMFLADKSIEIFVGNKKKVIPVKVFESGMLFGTFEAIDYLCEQQNSVFWHVTAGSRSVFTLPKISENLGLKRLKRQFEITSPIEVLSMQDHWHLFKQMTQSSNFTEPWQCRIFVFTQQWFDLIKKDPAWYKFESYLFKQAWFQSKQAALRNELMVDWGAMLKEILKRKMQPAPYILDTFRHLILCMKGQSVTFQPISDNKYAPVSGIQKALLEVYCLKKYAPTLLCAQTTTQDLRYPSYYSLSFPTLIEGSPQTKYNLSTIMTDIKNVKTLVDILLGNKALYKGLLKNKSFEYFHVDKDKDKEILSSRLIMEKDNRFHQHCTPSLEFCATSAFWRGCVMIRNFVGS